VLFEKGSHRVRRFPPPGAADESPQTRVVLRNPVREFSGSAVGQRGEEPPLLDAEVSFEVHFEFTSDFGGERFDFGGVGGTRKLPQAASQNEGAVMIVRKRYQRGVTFHA
jgi:hypothetical protein